MRPKRTDKELEDNKEIDELFSKVKDEYDAMAIVGKLMDKYDVSPKAKDSIKVIVKELINFGFNLGYTEAKNERV